MRKNYSSKNFRLEECKRLIKKYKVLQGYSTIKELANFNSAIRQHGDSLNGLALELGYTIEELYPTRKPEGYFNNFEIIESKINEFISNFGRFPTQNEFINDLGIANSHLLKFGGIYNIKRIMNYDDKNDLKDDRGFFNKSMQEYYVAQFLISHNIEYLREGKITENHNYLYDFLLEGVAGEKYYVEIWGYNDGNSTRANKYKEKMNKKIKIYNNNNLNLISINPNVFNKKSYNDINNELFNIFKNILNIKFKKVDNKVFIPSNKLSNEELKNELMSFSKDGITIPSQSFLTSIHRTDLFVEINRRYRSIFNFAKEHNLKTNHLNYGHWNEDSIFEVFDKMIENFGRILNKTECQSEEYKTIPFIKGFIGGVRRNSGLTENRIKYYEKLYSKNITIPQYEKEIMNKIINNIAPYNKLNGVYNNRIKKLLKEVI